MVQKKDSGKRKQMVSLEDAEENVRKVCVRLALLHYAFTKTLVDELGDVRGKQLAMNAIKLYAMKIGEGVREQVKAEGLEPLPEHYGEDLPKYGMHKGMETVLVGGERRTRAYGCVMGEVWRNMGVEELGRIYCYVDPAKYMAYNPDFKLIHYKSLPDGDEYCELGVERTTEHEKEAFTTEDTDLAGLDKAQHVL